MARQSGEASHSRQIIEYGALIVAYAMSRLDREFLRFLGLRSWRAAYEQLGSRLNVKPASFKNLRDEFDPFTGSGRLGWRNRPIRESRQRVIAEFSELSDDGLKEIVRQTLTGDATVRQEVIEPLIAARDRIENVALRLRTGRLAEEHFLRESENICGVPAAEVLDCRQNASGFDFGVRNRPSLKIEVKGLAAETGDILFTDLEWRTARLSRDRFWLVVIGSLPDDPKAKLYVDPFEVLRIRSVIDRCTRVSWRTRVSIR